MNWTPMEKFYTSTVRSFFLSTFFYPYLLSQSHNIETGGRGVVVSLKELKNVVFGRSLGKTSLKRSFFFFKVFLLTLFLSVLHEMSVSRQILISRSMLCDGDERGKKTPAEGWVNGFTVSWIEKNSQMWVLILPYLVLFVFIFKFYYGEWKV